MFNHSAFNPIRKIIIPFVHNGAGIDALEIARYFDAKIILVGIVVISSDQSLSHGAAGARVLRKQLRELAKKTQVTSRSQIIVSHQPWREFSDLLQKEKPDLLLLEWESHFVSLRITTEDVLTHPPCNVALSRGKILNKPKQVIVPLRGGPHAELALQVGLGISPKGITALHLRKTDDPHAGSDAPFKGLERVLKQMPDVKKQFEVTDDAAQFILDNANETDILVLGTTSQPMGSSTPLGAVADQILRESKSVVIAVKSKRLMPQSFYDESAGVQAISILVDKWFAENTFHADEFDSLKELIELKRKQGITISLALPALNEEKTVGRVISTIKNELVEKFPLLDEMVLIDSKSTDATRKIAEELGIPVYVHQDLLKRLGARHGKGEALWKSLLVTKGDIIVWIDTDIENIHPRFVYGILGPMLLNPQIQFVKGFYRRPLNTETKIQAGGGGRVTELTARPLLNLFYPELSGIAQPLSGEYGGRRSALEGASFFSGYGVEIGLLIDIYERYGLNAIAQVDLLERVHHSQPLEALSKMSFAIIQTVMHKLENRIGALALEDVNKSMKLIKHNKKGYFLDVEEIAERERPPMMEIPEYLERKD